MQTSNFEVSLVWGLLLKLTLHSALRPTYQRVHCAEIRYFGRISHDILFLVQKLCNGHYSQEFSFELMGFLTDRTVCKAMHLCNSIDIYYA